MSGLGYFLGGAMQGLGTGIVQKAQQDDIARRDAALSQMRQQEATQAAQLTGDNQAAHDQREAAAAMARQDDTQDFTAKQSSAAAGAASKMVQQKRIWDVEDREDGQAFEERKMRIQSALNTNSEIARIREEARSKGGDIFDVKTADDGTQTAVFRDGTEHPLKSKGTTKTQPAESVLQLGKGPIKALNNADIQELATKRGITPQQARDFAIKSGFQVQ